MYIFAYAVQPCIQTPDIAQCALRKKKELKEGGGSRGNRHLLFNKITVANKP